MPNSTLWEIRRLINKQVTLVGKVIQRNEDGTSTVEWQDGSTSRVPGAIVDLNKYVYIVNDLIVGEAHQAVYYRVAI